MKLGTQTMGQDYTNDNDTEVDLLGIVNINVVFGKQQRTMHSIQMILPMGLNTKYHTPTPI